MTLRERKLIKVCTVRVVGVVVALDVLSSYSSNNLNWMLGLRYFYSKILDKIAKANLVPLLC